MIKKVSKKSKNIGISDVMNTNLSRKLLNIAQIVGIVGSIVFIIWAFQAGFFTNEQKFQSVMNLLGPIAPIAFVLVQIVQTVIPLVPGSLTIPFGAFVFGHISGFILNFAGIMIGSLINFYLAKQYGRPLVRNLISEDQFNKYVGWMESSKNFDRLFAFGMFVPFSPADVLCYIAGLSNMRFRKYMLILLTSKPVTLVIYTYGTYFGLAFLGRLITG